MRAYCIETTNKMRNGWHMKSMIVMVVVALAGGCVSAGDHHGREGHRVAEGARGGARMTDSSVLTVPTGMETDSLALVTEPAERVEEWEVIAMDLEETVSNHLVALQSDLARAYADLGAVMAATAVHLDGYRSRRRDGHASVMDAFRMAVIPADREACAAVRRFIEECEEEANLALEDLGASPDGAAAGLFAGFPCVRPAESRGGAMTGIADSLRGPWSLTVKLLDDVAEFVPIFGDVYGLSKMFCELRTKDLETRARLAATAYSAHNSRMILDAVRRHCPKAGELRQALLELHSTERVNNLAIMEELP
jgi:hypothetical protein